MALSVGNDLAALLTAVPPDAGSRRVAASPASISAASPPDFAALLSSLGEDGQPAADQAPPSRQSLMAPAAQRPPDHVAAAMEWPWASLAAAAEEATTLAGQFQRPSVDMAMPAEDAALPEQAEAVEPAEPMPPQAAAVVAQAVLHPPPLLPPEQPTSGAAARSLAQPAEAPAPGAVDDQPAPAEPSVQPGHQMPRQPPAGERAEAPQPAGRALPPVAKEHDAVAPGVSGPRADRPAPAGVAPPQSMAAPPVAPAPVQHKAEAAVVEGMVVALAADAARATPPQRRPLETRRPAGQDMAASAPVSTRASSPSLPPLLSMELAAQEALARQEPAEAEGLPILPQPGRAMPAAEAVAGLEPEFEVKPAARDAMPLALPPSAPPEPRADVMRQASSPQLTPRPHLLPETGQQLALRVVTAAANRVESVSVDLRPPELGRVELRLTFQDGTVQVSMAVERSDTFEALRQDRIHLEQQMQQAGLQLGSGGLDLQHGHLPREAPESRPAPPARAEGPEAAEEETPMPRLPPSDSLIDLIA